MVAKVLSFFCFTCLLWAQVSFAQDEKREYEQSIKKREVPTEILNGAAPFLQKATRVKYYYETDGEEESYEIKGRMQHRYYSVEYQKDGRLVDIEMLIDFEEIPESARNKITQHLGDNYDKYVLTRLQQQYFPHEKEAALEDFTEQNFKDFDIRYELEVDTRSNNQLGSFELLFDKEGKLLQERKIVRRTEDNIFY